VDGAEWEQGFIDLHCPKAVRILDFGHAGEHVADAGRVVYGEDTEPLRAWLGQELHTLKHEQPETVVGDLQRLKDRQLDGQPLGEQKTRSIDENVSYLEKRYEHMRYAQFIQSGYPIGSGMVESGNKLVVEARLKGAGMHWARQMVNPMLALRNVACSDRWQEAWPQICQQLRMARRAEQQKRWAERRATREPAAGTAITDTKQESIIRPPTQPKENNLPTPRLHHAAPREQRRPATDHPWRHAPIGSTRYGLSQGVSHPKS
jgi:hypothetical protein